MCIASLMWTLPVGAMSEESEDRHGEHAGGRLPTRIIHQLTSEVGGETPLCNQTSESDSHVPDDLANRNIDGTDRRFERLPANSMAAEQSPFRAEIAVVFLALRI
jgi:hypothetical protein